MSSEPNFPKRRQLPKLMACVTKSSLENLRNKALFNLTTLDAKEIRRKKLPLQECLILELRESGYIESANYLQDLIYDNIQILADDDIGIVVDLRKKDDYLEHIVQGLRKAEKARDTGNTRKESLVLLNLALHYMELEKGILWLAEKFFLAAIAVSSQYLLDGGRLKGCCKYHYGKFLLDKFPGTDAEEPFVILSEVRDSCIGKDWLLEEAPEDGSGEPVDLSPTTLFAATARQLHRVLLYKARILRRDDPAKGERLCRLAERRAVDANDTGKVAEAVIEIGICQLLMNSLNNAKNSFDRALKIHTNNDNVEGLCETKMHMAAVMQRLGDHENAAILLTEMGALAMDHGFRRQLGRALHLLGELHLRREIPELGTQHLSEAFSCFMGIRWQSTKPQSQQSDDKNEGGLNELFRKDIGEIFHDEAEQSRLMMAISAGQELMPSYFNLIRESRTCSVAKIKTIEWKLSYAGWWVEKPSHDLIPCMCVLHNRTPLDVLRFQLDNLGKDIDDSKSHAYLDRTDTVEDFGKMYNALSSHATSTQHK